MRAILGLAFACSSGPLAAQWVPERADGIPPAGVRGGHVLAAGEWWLRYDYLTRSYGGNRDGGDSVGDGEVLASFPIVPTRLRAQTHSFTLGHEVADGWTGAAELPFELRTMYSRTASGERFEYRSEGVGDARLWLLPAIDRGAFGALHANAGVSLPTGSIDENGASAGGVQERLPYAMQLGSGTVDLLPGLTWNLHADAWSCGGQGLLTLRLSENRNDYTLGNRVDMSLWGAYRLSEQLSPSLRLAFAHWEEVSGADPAMRRNAEPSADPDAQGGDRCDLSFGMNWYGTGDFLPGQRIGVEVGVPLLQDLNGPQLEYDWSVQLNVELRFGGAAGAPNYRVM